MKNRKLVICIMAGGSGERFWPLSRNAKPKHLLRLFGNETLLEMAWRRIEPLTEPENVYILSNRVQIPEIRNTLDLFLRSNVIAEPAKRDTGPACALATGLAARLDKDAIVVMLPADALIRDGETYRSQLETLVAEVARQDAIGTIAVAPAYPATGFGYMELGDACGAGGAKWPCFHVKRFVEKPPIEKAREFLAAGNYGWNAGIFAWSVGRFLAEADRHAPELATFVERYAQTDRPEELLEDAFPHLPKQSVDYAIMEHARGVIAVRSAFDWDDVGSWNAVLAHLDGDAQGNVMRGKVVMHDASGNLVFADKKLVALCGVNDLVVVDCADALLVCHKDAAQDVKKLLGGVPPDLL